MSVLDRDFLSQFKEVTSDITNEMRETLPFSTTFGTIIATVTKCTLCQNKETTFHRRLIMITYLSTDCDLRNGHDKHL
jgi:hypothetical protein